MVLVLVPAAVFRRCLLLPELFDWCGLVIGDTRSSIDRSVVDNVVRNVRERVENLSFL